ncbi:low temperature requirement protein A [Lysobacter sp. KIS68-7]|uniref:low temperature requirement protein A n=1 Tax=Lysobacter sp. KIS68-7 TaxID=2904252 RepID=UPI001E650A0C|nr:low temperature requirement protein A [Lysobacter sp. KIS68-7]UHQ19284.1 low temperature requirement protein A [Lysobacter sp. KIS68-7]
MPATLRRPRTSLLRTRGEHDSGKVGFVELFFDLVFVFAVTQLSHTLLAGLTPAGMAQVGLLLLGVWWVWINTSWVTNWLDPERIPVRVAVLALMLAGLCVSVAIPQAFDSRGMVFACAYVAMQLGRTVFFLWAVRGEHPNMRRNFQRILAWLLVSSVCWIVGAFNTHDVRFGWWALALAIETIAPLAYFWVPGLGRSTIEDWDVVGGHLAERCGLFIIIALGESLLVTGATFAALDWNGDTLLAFANAVLGSVLLWWIYFDTGAPRATRRIESARDPGREARSAYTYAHILIVAGIIVCAVADELVLAHPHQVPRFGLAVVIGGPWLYLLGNALFKWITNNRRAPPLSHLVGLAMFGAVAGLAWAGVLSPLALALIANGVLLVVAAWESLAIRRGARPPVEA